MCVRERNSDREKENLRIIILFMPSVYCIGIAIC